MALADVSVADLRALLKQAEEAQAEAEKETPLTRVLADLADHRVDPGRLADVLGRVFRALELLGVDLLAEDGPALVGKAAPAEDERPQFDPDDVFGLDGDRPPVDPIVPPDGGVEATREAGAGRKAKP